MEEAEGWQWVVGWGIYVWSEAEVKDLIIPSLMI